MSLIKRSTVVLAERITWKYCTFLFEEGRLLNVRNNEEKHFDTNRQRTILEIAEPTDMDILKQKLDNLIFEVKYLADVERQNDKSRRIADQWKFTAHVLDRFCGVILIFVMAIIFIYMYIQARK